MPKPKVETKTIKESLIERPAEEEEQPISEIKDQILNLPLPNHLNHLMRLFEQFEMNLRLHKQRHDIWTCSFDNLKA